MRRKVCEISACMSMNLCFRQSLKKEDVREVAAAAQPRHTTIQNEVPVDQMLHRILAVVEAARFVVLQVTLADTTSMEELVTKYTRAATAAVSCNSLAHCCFCCHSRLVHQKLLPACVIEATRWWPWASGRARRRTHCWRVPPARPCSAWPAATSGCV